MAGFEVIVRPVVFPSIRPPPARSLPPEDDPEQGIAVLSGSGGGLIDLSHSVSQSASKSKPQEIERREDEARVYQKENDGTINRNNFVDIRVANKITVDDSGPGYGTPGVTIGGGVGVLTNERVVTEYFYSSITDKVYDNIEILEKDIVTKNEKAVK